MVGIAELSLAGHAESLLKLHGDLTTTPGTPDRGARGTFRSRGRREGSSPVAALTPCGSSSIVAAVMIWRRAMTWVALAVFLVLPPLAMAFGGCAGMAQMCEAPCGASGCA